jgi:hypothetical protein
VKDSVEEKIFLESFGKAVQRPAAAADLEIGRTQAEITVAIAVRSVVAGGLTPMLSMG